MAKRGRALELCNQWAEGADGSSYEDFLEAMVIACENEIESLRRQIMRVRVYPEKTIEEFGAVRWEVEWQEVKPSADKRIRESAAKDELDEIDPDRDLIWKHLYFKSKAAAMAKARKVYAAGVSAFGSVTVQKQVVDWFVEEDRVAEWADVGEPEYVDE